VRERLVVLISGSGSNMQALVGACQRGDVPGRVAGVVADRPCAGVEWAAANNVPFLVVEPGPYPSRDDWSKELRDRVLEVQADVVVSAGFMRILAPVFVDAFPGRLINLHPSLLPAFPGAHAVRDALAAGVKVTGTTIHFVDHLVDHGPIILQEPVRVEPNDTEISLHERIKEVEHRLLPEACRLMLENRVKIVQGRVVIKLP
jgi:phosphoribosylglycinamide formyltransferase 1